MSNAPGECKCLTQLRWAIVTSIITDETVLMCSSFAFAFAWFGDLDFVDVSALTFLTYAPAVSFLNECLFRDHID